MAYTVKQVAAMSGVSVRTLHFYDEAGLVKPSYHGANGYRYYEEPQLLILQQVLFYRELGFGLKQIRETLGRADFEIVAALLSHRELLRQNLARTRTLIETIDKTVDHLRGTKAMEKEELFSGFVVAADGDRFDEQVRLGGEPHRCKVSGEDTGGAMCVFEFTGTADGPRRLHHDQDEWIYVVDGEIEVHVGEQQVRLSAGGSVFIPRETLRVWASADGAPCRIIDVFQPAGTIEAFYREAGSFEEGGPIHEVLGIEGLAKLFADHGMELLGPPLRWEE
jgi:DNA-binding transcriptional MerR regulator/uncharacterized cupin superfamily protein